MYRFLSGLLFLTSAPVMSQAVSDVATSGKTQVASESTTRQINVSFNSIPLQEAIWSISHRGGIRVIFDGKILPAKKVSYQAVNIAPEAALEAILRGTQIKIHRLDDGAFQLVRLPSQNAAVVQTIITGRVVDKNTGRGVSGANVWVDNDTRAAVTGEDGAYRLTGISAGVRTVSVRLVGYAKQSRSVTVGEGVTVTIDFKLEPSTNVLDQVVVTGTVVATELKAVPSAITVVTARQLEERGITRIDQLFRGDIPGLFASNLGAASALDEVTMYSRGATTTGNNSAGSTTTDGLTVHTNPIKTYIDGVELADPRFLSQIDPTSIERIEILTGPQASTIYGSNALNGVMQIFTKRGRAGARPDGLVNLSSGFTQNNFNSALAPNHAGSIRFSGLEGRVSYNTDGSVNYSGAWTPGKQTVRYALSGGARAEFGKLRTDVSFRRALTRNVQRGSESQWTTERRTNGEAPPSSSAGVAFNNVSVLNGQTYGLTAGYNPFSWWSHTVTLGYDSSDRDKMQPVPRNSFAGDTTLEFTQAFGSRTSQQYSTTFIAPLHSALNLNITFGADHWRTHSYTVNASPIVLTGNLANPEITRDKPDKNAGGFMQAQVGLFDALFLTYGLRAEWNPNFGADIQPNLAPRYGFSFVRDLGSMSAKLRASYGRSTRPPLEIFKVSERVTSSSLIQLFGIYDTQLANPGLLPENQQGWEGGVDLYFSNRGRLTVTRYNQTVDDLLNSVKRDSVRSLLLGGNGTCITKSDGYCYGFQFQYLNIGSIRNQGWELQGNINTGPFTTEGTYSWTKSRVLAFSQVYLFNCSGNCTPGNPFNFVPEHTWAVTIKYAQTKNSISMTLNGIGQIYKSNSELTLSTNAVSSGFRYSTSIVRVGTPNSYRPLAAGYVTADLNGSHRFSQRLEGTVKVQNLTDFYRNDRTTQHATAGRQTTLGLRFKL